MASMRTRALAGVATIALAFPASGSAQVTRLPGTPATLGSDANRLPYDEGATGLALAIKRLATRASVIAVVAHPDDEDGALLTYESRDRGSRTTLVTLNRGEGGENAMGSDFGEALGLIRTQELLRADQYYGADQYWTNVIDYGFSKTPEEALKHWGDDRALADVVRVIRKARPLVVTSSFTGAQTDGHGHHQVAGISAQRAFAMAGDPNAFPEQITKEGLRPWSPLKVYGRVPLWGVTDKGMFNYATGQFVPVRFKNYADGSTIEGMLSTDVVVPTGTMSPWAGRSYAQIARHGLSHQKSQFAMPFGATLPGAAPSSYHRFGSRVAGAAKEADMFDGIDVSLLGIADLAPEGARKALRDQLAPLARTVAEIERDFDPSRPQAVAAKLADGRRLVRDILGRVRAGTLPDQAKYDIAFELEAKERQFGDALAQALGVVAVASLADGKPDNPMMALFLGNTRGTEPRTVTRGQDVWVKFHLIAQSGEPVTVSDFRIHGADQRDWRASLTGDAPTTLAANTPATVTLRAQVPADQPYTRAPYHRPSPEAGWYEVDDTAMRNRPYAPFPMMASAVLHYRGEDIAIDRTVEGSEASKAAGPMPVPALVVPELSVAVRADRDAIPLDGGKTGYTVTVRNDAATARTGVARLSVPAGWTATPAEQPFSVDPRGGTQQLSFSVTTNGRVAPANYAIGASAESNGQRFAEGYTLIGYDGLASYPLYAPSVARATAVDVQLPKDLRIAYVTGSGDVLPAALTGLGVSVDQLTADQVVSRDFAPYDAVVLGVGAYSKRPELAAANKKLRAYVEGGGIVVMQGSVGWSGTLAPYPVVLGDTSTEVTDEHAPVTMLRPESTLLTWPNRIVAADFDGWVDQRGDGFLRQWDDKYVPILAMHDEGQDVQRGGLLDLPLGKGHFIYSALAFYRQVPAGVPGAIRLLANLISQRKVAAK